MQGRTRQRVAGPCSANSDPPSAIQQLVIGLGKEAARAPHECSHQDATRGRFSDTQTHARLGSAQRNDTQEARKWSGPWGRESQANGPQRALRVDNETLKGKKKNGSFQEGDHTGKSNEVETDPGRNRGLGGGRERI